MSSELATINELELLKLKAKARLQALQQQSQQQLQPEEPSLPAYTGMGDIAKSGGIGTVEGAIGLAGLPGDIRNLALRGVGWGAEQLGMNPDTVKLVQQMGAENAIPGMNAPSSQQIQQGVESVTGPFYQSQSQLGEGTRTAGNFASGLLLPGGPVRRLAQWLLPAAGSEVGGAIAKQIDPSYEPYGNFTGSIIAGGPLAAGRSNAARIAAEIGSPSKSAVSKIAQAVANDAGPMAPLGPEHMLMDVGPNLQRQGRGIFSIPGEGSKTIHSALDTRAKSTTARVTDTVNKVMGTRLNTVEQAARLKAARTNTGSPLYDAAFANAGNVDVTPVVDAINVIVKPTGLGLGPAARTEIGKKLLSIRSQITLGGKSRVIDGRSLQTVYQDIGDKIGAAVREGKNNTARVLGGIKKELENSIDDATGGAFSAANKQWSTDSRIMDAFEEGQTLFRNSTSRDELKAMLKTMEPAAKNQLISGLRNQVDEIVGTARNDAAAARALIDKGWNREKMEMVVGKPKADILAQRLGWEKLSQETNQFVTRGSSTAPGLAGIHDVSAPLRDYGPAYVYGGSLGLVRRIGLNALDKIAGAFTHARGDKMQAEMAKILTTSGPERDRILKILTGPKSNPAMAALARAMLQGQASQAQVQLQGPNR